MLLCMTRHGRRFLRPTGHLEASTHRFSSILSTRGQIQLSKIRSQTQCLYFRTSSVVKGDDPSKDDTNSDGDESEVFLASRSDMPKDFRETLKPSKFAKSRITEPVASAREYQEYASSRYENRENERFDSHEETFLNRSEKPKSRNKLKRSGDNSYRERYPEPENPSLPLKHLRNKEKLIADVDQYSSIDYMEPRSPRQNRQRHGSDPVESQGRYMDNPREEEEEFKQSGQRMLGHRLRSNQNEPGFEKERRTKRFDDRPPPPDRYNFGLEGEGRHSKDKYERLAKRQPRPELQGEALFGKFPCLIALQQSRRHVYRLYCLRSWLESEDPVHREILDTAETQGVTVETCERSRLDLMSKSRPNQGVCLDASKMRHEELDDSVFSGDGQLCLLLDSIKDPMNLGSILRAAYYLGVDKILSVTTNSVPLNPVVSKASTGVMEVLPVYGVTQAEGTVQLFRERGWHVLGTVGSVDKTPDLAEKCVPVSDVELHSNTLLIIGSEGRGITTEVMSQCDQLVTIAPGRSLHPHMDSLNVSVATGIILQHIMSKKSQKT